ncbi:glycine/D-amino acid oxidase-like deaminating enzyme [Haloactinospora alba]|uniref:Glycine/D-amino acid oxidase-like deaminating enzyme n=1 Tax=Haloactinospora alba TaxID=405555 RepID=A0A543NH53_9ACTN|nr:FAD-binding oxidoreductase [Haloactinospora alba]TQN31186.1 glycine/D-amino acid oxidase-like deaminating enzyme [Haloactinospora alba]
MRVVIVGGGVIGLAIAHQLAGTGNEVTVLEASRPGAGTSSTSFAWVNSHAKDPLSYHELNAAGVRAHHAMDAAHPRGPRWFFPTGNLEWADNAEHERVLANSVARLRERGCPAEWLDPEQARSLEPGLRIPESARSLAFFPEEGHVRVGEYLGRLLTDARAGGVRVLCPARVTQLATHSGGATATLDDGTTVEADTVISAAGRWTGELLATADVHLPVADPREPGSATGGYLAYTEPAPVRLQRVLTTSRLNVRPDGGGRLVLQGLDLDPDADRGIAGGGPDSAIAAEFRERLAAVLTGGEHTRVTDVRVGQRALPADGLTVCGFVDDHQRLYTVVTHSGVTLAPALAPMVAGEVLAGTPAAELAGFRPARFGSGTTAGAPGRARVPGEQ